MTTEKSDHGGPQTNWFVGATYSGTEDQSQRFLSEGIWENGFEDRYFDVVRTMRAGDRIAIKSSYTRKHGLPFDNRGQSVSVMAIKAIGTIVENLNDGKRVRVKWTKFDPPREWYFYTHRGTIWRVLSGEWNANELIAFTFDGKPQDFERFRNAPYWRERFGSEINDSQRFIWTEFYEAIANKLLAFRNSRAKLLEGIRSIASRVDGLGHLTEDKYSDGATGFIRDICPFTTMGLFNRGITNSNRRIIAAELAKFLGVTEPVPDTFEGIPVLNNLKSWYFPYENKRTADHIDSLWDVFTAGLAFVESDDDDSRLAFSRAFDNANGRPGVAWNITFGLYWARPWSFVSLDHNSKIFINRKLGMQIGLHGPKKRCNADDYLAVMDALDPRFSEALYPVHSYPELSLAAWAYKDPAAEISASQVAESNAVSSDEEEDDKASQEVASRAVPASYGVNDILREGCFLPRAEIVRLLERVQAKKNLILQGPPGTGKTWLARRLAFALIGTKDESKIRAVQFHPNLSYEDFVRGWRPSREGLSLVDGIFMEAIKAAANNPMFKYVVVIEEINRGNPAQIFGELLTLLEAGKRTPNEAIELCYSDSQDNRKAVHIPENLYVIGTMNVADRSLALVDLALRRRFAFVSLDPRFGEAWRTWVVTECNVDSSLIAEIERRMTELNIQIAADTRLGKQFQIGHSYVTPAHRLEPHDSHKWFQEVVETEIGPLLDEYWFDAPDEAHKACMRLLQGW